MSSYGFIKELIEKEHTPTPAYVFDLDKMKEFVKKVQSCLGESTQLCYAMKANPFLTGPMMDVVPTFEVCSPGEFRICERVGVTIGSPSMERSSTRRARTPAMRRMECHFGPAR